MSCSPKKVTFDSHKDDLFLSFEETNDGPLLDHLDEASADHRLSISQDPVFLVHSEDYEEDEQGKRHTRSTRNSSPVKKKKNDKKSPKKSRASTSPSKDRNVSDEIPSPSIPFRSMPTASQYSPAGIVIFFITLCLIIFSISDFGLSEVYRGSCGINSLLRSRYFNVLDNILATPSVDITSLKSEKKAFTDDEKVNLAYTAANQLMRRYVSLPSTALTWPWTSLVRHHQLKITSMNHRKRGNEADTGIDSNVGTKSLSNVMLQDMDPLYSSDENLYMGDYNNEDLMKYMTNAQIPSPSHKDLLQELFGKMGYCDTEEKASRVSSYLTQAYDDEYMRSWLRKLTFNPFSSQSDDISLSNLPAIHHPTTEELNVKIDRPLEDGIVYYKDASLSIQLTGSVLAPLTENGYEIKASSLATRFSQLEAERLIRAENETTVGHSKSKSISDIALEMMPSTRTAVLDIRLDGRPLRFSSGSRYEIPLRGSVSMSFDLNEHGLTNGVHLVEVIVTLEGPSVKDDITISSQYSQLLDRKANSQRGDTSNTFSSSHTHVNRCAIIEAKEQVRQDKIKMMRVMNDIRVASSVAFYIYGIGLDEMSSNDNTNLGNKANNVHSGSNGNTHNQDKISAGDSILVHLVPDESTDVLPLFYAPSTQPILHDAIHMTFPQDQRSVVLYTVVNVPNLTKHTAMRVVLHINENNHDITDLILKEIHNQENIYIDEDMAIAMGNYQGVLKRISLNMTGVFNKGRHALKMCIYDDLHQQERQVREAVQCHEAFIDIV